MSNAESSIKHVLIQGTFAILAAFIGAAATLWAARSGNLPPSVAPSAIATATVTQTVTDHPSPTASTTQADAIQGNPQWVARMDPLTEAGLWEQGQATIRGDTYLHSLIVSTEWADVETDTSWQEYALDGRFSNLSGSVGIADGGHSSEEANFQVIIDDRIAFEDQIRIGEEPTMMDVDVSRADNLRIQVTDIDNSAYASTAVFADLALE